MAGLFDYTTQPIKVDVNLLDKAVKVNALQNAMQERQMNEMRMKYLPQQMEMQQQEQAAKLRSLKMDEELFPLKKQAAQIGIMKSRADLIDDVIKTATIDNYPAVRQTLIDGGIINEQFLPADIDEEGLQKLKLEGSGVAQQIRAEVLKQTMLMPGKLREDMLKTANAEAIKNKHTLSEIERRHKLALDEIEARKKAAIEVEKEKAKIPSKANSPEELAYQEHVDRLGKDKAMTREEFHKLWRNEDAANFEKALTKINEASLWNSDLTRARTEKYKELKAGGLPHEEALYQALTYKPVKETGPTEVEPDAPFVKDADGNFKFF